MKRFLLILTFCFSSFVGATSLDKIVVFGDSLSDTGNLYEYMKHQLPLSPPYYQGRFTNGPVWVEVLSNYYYPEAKHHLLVYAFGGAGVLEDDSDDELFTLKKEVDAYFLTVQNKADPNALFVIWIGANNYLAMPDNPQKAVSEVIHGIDKEIKKLTAKGAKHILLVNVPNLGRIPAARDFESEELLSFLAREHNSALFKQFNEYKTQHPEIEWVYYDIFQDMEEMMRHPALYGFNNVVGTCYEQLKPLKKESILKIAANLNFTGNANPCDGYLFFDPVHPSARAHELIAERIKAVFEEKGIDFRTTHLE